MNGANVIRVELGFAKTQPLPITQNRRNPCLILFRQTSASLAHLRESHDLKAFLERLWRAPMRCTRSRVRFQSNDPPHFYLPIETTDCGASTVRFT